MIDWTNPKDKVSKYFTVKECLYLPAWSRMATEDDYKHPIILANLTDLCLRMDKVRAFFGFPVIVHCAYRPENYNLQVGGVPDSAHIQGQAMDFHVESVDCNLARDLLVSHLEEFGLRLENKHDASWLHCDTAPVINERYFKV